MIVIVGYKAFNSPSGSGPSISPSGTPCQNRTATGLGTWGLYTTTALPSITAFAHTHFLSALAMGPVGR